MYVGCWFLRGRLYLWWYHLGKDQHVNASTAAVNFLGCEDESAEMVGENLHTIFPDAVENLGSCSQVARVLACSQCFLECSILSLLDFDFELLLGFFVVFNYVWDLKNERLLGRTIAWLVLNMVFTDRTHYTLLNRNKICKLGVISVNHSIQHAMDTFRHLQNDIRIGCLDFDGITLKDFHNVH